MKALKCPEIGNIKKSFLLLFSKLKFEVGHPQMHASGLIVNSIPFLNFRVIGRTGKPLLILSVSKIKIVIFNI